MICDECETVAHCLKNGCVPKQPSKDEALKRALEFVDANHSGGPDAFELITTIKQALASPVQQSRSDVEPVAWVTGLHAGRCVIQTINPSAILPVGIALYTAPPYVATPLDDATHMAAPVPDIPDLIAGALGVSRGTAYDLIREALKEAAPVQEQVAAELERIAQEPPVNGNNLAQARVLMAAQRIRNAIPPNVATPLEETASLAAPAPEERKRQSARSAWVGLTDDEIAEIADRHLDVGDGERGATYVYGEIEFARAIEAAHGITEKGQP